MDILATGQHAWIANRIAAWTRQHVFAVEGPQQALHLHVGADLLQAKAQIGEELVEFSLINCGKTG